MTMFTGHLSPKRKSISMLVHYGHLPDKNCCFMSRDIWTSRAFRVQLFIYSAISRGTPNNRMHKPGWETLGFRYGICAIVV